MIPRAGPIDEGAGGEEGLPPRTRERRDILPDAEDRWARATGGGTGLVASKRGLEAVGDLEGRARSRSGRRRVMAPETLLHAVLARGRGFRPRSGPRTMEGTAAGAMAGRSVAGGQGTRRRHDHQGQQQAGGSRPLPHGGRDDTERRVSDGGSSEHAVLVDPVKMHFRRLPARPRWRSRRWQPGRESGPYSERLRRCT